MLFFDDLMLLDDVNEMREKAVAEHDYYENESFSNGREMAILEAISEYRESEIWN